MEIWLRKDNDLFLVGKSRFDIKNMKILLIDVIYPINMICILSNYLRLGVKWYLLIVFFLGKINLGWAKRCPSGIWFFFIGKMEGLNDIILGKNANKG